MKKLLMLLFLMTISLGQSQNFPLDFTGGTDVLTGFDGNVFSIITDEGNEVGQLVSVNQLYDNYQLTLAQTLNLSDDGNNTITFRIKPIGDAGLTTRNHLLKFEGGTGGAAQTELAFTTTGNDWQVITLNFGAGLGSYAKLVLFTDFNNTLTGTYLVDDFVGGTNNVPTCNDGVQNGTETGIDCGGTCNPCGVTAPADAAQSPPARNVGDVLSIFTDAVDYNVQSGTNFSPYWGQPGAYIAPTIVGVGTPSNNTLLYQNLTYQGVQFSAPVNVLTMTNLHLDVWSPSSTSMDVVLIGGGENGFVITLVPGQWNSIDIPMSNYAARTLNSIGQMMFRNTTPAGGKVYVDNIYFWKAPAGTFTYYADADGDGYGAGAAVSLTAETAPTGYSVNNTDCNDANAAVNPGATEIADTIDNDCDGSIDEGFPPTFAAPTPPARNAWDVKSIFSGAYDNVALDELPTEWSQLALAPFSVESIGGNDTWKFGGEFLGMAKYSGNGINLSDMTMMHIDYWTPDNKVMIAKIVNTTGPVTEGLTIVQDPVVTGTWRSVDIPMAQFGGSVDKSKITQILLDPQLGGSTVYVDNLYFYRPATSASSPSITNFTVPSKLIGDASFQLTPPTSNSTGAFTYTVTGASGVATISGDMVTIVGGGSTIITATQAAADGFDSGSITASFVVSFPPPATAAPTPTRAAGDVISIFSNAYTDKVGTAFRSFFGTTALTQVNIDGNPTNRYTDFDYVGNTFGAGGVNASAMEKLHLDIWTPDCTSFDVYILDGSNPEQKVTLTPTTSEWNSFDIDLAEYTSLTKSGIVEFKFERSGTTDKKTIYLDNIYFWKTPSYYVDADGDGYGAGTALETSIEGSVTNNTDCNDGDTAINPGATEILDGIDNDCDSSIDEGFPPATDAPTAPARNAWDVISVYSNAYTTITPTPNYYPIWDAVAQTTQFSNYTPVSDETLKYSNLNFQGIDFNGGKNVSAMTKLHLDVYTRDLSSFKVSLIAGGENAVTLTPTLAGWNSYDLDLATQYADRNLSNAIQLKLERTLWTPTDGNVNSLYVDNIYFYRAATGSTYYVDADGDGYGAGTAVTLEPSTAPSGYSAVAGDCSPTNAAINPGATEIFDTIDNDCDGSIDEGTTLPAPVVTSSSRCKVTVGVAPTAVALPGYTLVWYSVATGGTALTATPLITSTTKTYWVAQKLGAGTPSPRAQVTTTVNNLPATPSALTSLDAKNICKYIDSDTPVLFSATATGASSYIWTTTIANITESDITNDGAEAFISFKNASTTPGLIGSVLVQIQDANGCVSLPKSLSLTTKVPTAPTSLTMTSANSTPHFNGIITPAVGETPAVTGLVGLNSLVKITKVGPYMGTETVFTLTAAEAPTAASYEWTLNGATQLTGGNGRIITVDFAGVEPGIGTLPVVVKSVGGCGPSTARTLTLARAVPTAPTKLVLTDDAISTTAITKVGPYTGKSTELTLTATPFTTQGGTATSYAWILPAGVNCETSNTPTTVKVKSTVNTGTVEAPIYAINDVAAIATASSTITINLDDVQSGVTSLPIQVFGVNGAGNSIARTLTLSAAAPATPAIVGSGGNGTANQFGSCLTKTYTATPIPGATYTWTAPGGTITQTGNVIVVDYSTTSVALLGSSTVTCFASNGTGDSGVKSLTVKRIACTGTRLAPEATTTEKFSAVAYPNPATEGFRVKSSNGKSFGVQVYDMLGRSIEQRQMSSDAQIGSNYAKGIYNVIVNQGANVKTLRVIKQ